METSLRRTQEQVAKSLRDLNTHEVCQWFTSIGLHKCLPFIRDANLCGADIAAVDVNTLDILRIVTVADREHLLSAIYNELHPPNTTTQRLHTLLETSGQNKVDTLTSTFMSMSKSKSSSHVSCLSMNQRSLKLRQNGQNYTQQRSSPLMEIIITASQQTVHLRTPKETTLRKIMDTCIRMLGMMEEKDLFKQGSVEVLSLDQQVGSLLTSSIDNTQLELQLCRMVGF
ncbi:uncharacterized protein LOC117522952 [Thalassophryne amazonica]|uniref:uncharacterized protein LOC117522952 n=1 Tax=Thalassophryne amazonica TaxID=390379 RepID=UPI001470EAA8|nr:uncharacterized protein LOC117522952 [Thalassophryne amazonica]